MAPDPARPARVATFALMGVAYATCEVAAYLDGRPRPFGVAFGLALFAVALAVNRFLPVPVPGRRPSARFNLVLGAVLVLPVLGEPLLRAGAGEGFPLEMQLVNGLRILGVALAGVSAWPRFRRLAGVVSLFLALFASAMGDQPAIPYLLVAFAVAGGLWLILEHRATHADAVATVAADEGVRVAMRLPFREAFVFGTLAVLAGGVALAGPKRVMLTLGELMPTSGGTGDIDPFARYGVGDGPEETAGENAKAAGMVETDTMIEDDKDALIDAVNDMFGPPHKPPKERERMVAAGVLKVIENHDKLAENRRPSRDFDTGRRGPKSAKKPDGRAARGVFEVEGRTPLHIRLAVYEKYDPVGRWEEGRKPGSRTLEAEGGDWMHVGHLRDADWYAADDRHKLNVADLKENLVPTPALFTRVRINKVDRPDYYEWDYDGVLALAGRKMTPPGVVVTTDCRTLDTARLPAAAFGRVGSFGGMPPVLSEVPDVVRPEIELLAREWAGGRPEGWPQVEAILMKLRTEYTFDRTAAPPAGHPAPVLWFLTDSRRGPDYLFATSAALLLRSLGYPARVCLGYYASPDAYDPETDHTPVKGTDLHLWAEVGLRDGHWLVVEPTPGYDTLPPRKPWEERLADAAAALAAWAGRNWLGLAAVVVGVGVLVRRRKRVVDAVHTAVWRLRPGRTWQETTLRTARILDRRGRLAGRPRLPAQTFAQWSAGLGQEPDLGHFVRLAEWAAYAPTLPPPTPDATTVCRQALDRWTLRHLTATRRPTA